MSVHLSAGDVTYLAGNWTEMARMVVTSWSDDEIVSMPAAAFRRVRDESCHLGERRAVNLFNHRVSALVRDGRIGYHVYSCPDPQFPGSTRMCLCLGNRDLSALNAGALLRMCCQTLLRGRIDVRRLPEELLREVQGTFDTLMSKMLQYEVETRDPMSYELRAKRRVFRVNGGEALLVSNPLSDLPNLIADMGYRVDDLRFSEASVAKLFEQVEFIQNMVKWFPELVNPLRWVEGVPHRRADMSDLLVVTDPNCGLGELGHAR